MFFQTVLAMHIYFSIFFYSSFLAGDCETALCVCVGWFFSCFVSFYPLQSMAFRSFILPSNQFDWDFRFVHYYYWIQALLLSSSLCLSVCVHVQYMCCVIAQRLTFKVMHCFSHNVFLTWKPFSIALHSNRQLQWR